MTDRLYLADPYLKSFRARVVEMRDLDGKPAAVLDRTARSWRASWHCSAKTTCWLSLG